MLLWGQTEGNPGITPLFSFSYGADRLLISFTFIIKIRFFNQVLQPGQTQQQSPTAASLPRYMPAMSKHLNIAGLLFVTLSFVANICYAKGDTNQISKPILRIAKKIAKYKTVDDNAVGFAGRTTEQYKRLLSLTQLASDNELVILTDHANEKVRAYAFWALAKRKYSNILQILEKHLGDTSTIEFYSGCMMTPKRVNYFYLDVLTPTHIDEDSFKLTTQEINKYYRKITEATEQKKKLAGI